MRPMRKTLLQSTFLVLTAGGFGILPAAAQTAPATTAPTPVATSATPVATSVTPTEVSLGE